MFGLTDSTFDGIATPSPLAAEQEVRAQVSVTLNDGFEALRESLGLKTVPHETEGGYEWKRSEWYLDNHREQVESLLGEDMADRPSVRTDANPDEGETVEEITIHGRTNDVVEITAFIERATGQEATFEKVVGQ